MTDARSSLRRALPGLVLCVLVAAGALLLERLEMRAAGRPWVEALALAILLGGLVRTLMGPLPRFQQGIDFAAKPILEAAVVFMGASVSFGAILAVGLPLLAAIVATVIAAIATSFMIGRLLGLSNNMALLVACGNAICGNSAIAAVAPVIEADSDEVAASIAFTAVLGIAVVLAVPMIASSLHLRPAAGGILAGLTVYAVPQVLAAANPLGVAAVQTATLVKLGRVLMLGPVVAVLSLVNPVRRNVDGSAVRLMPHFIMGFLLLAAMHSLGLLPRVAQEPAHAASQILTVLSMAGLGLGVDFRSIRATGPCVALTAVLSILILGGAAFAVLRMIGLL